ncbi:MAG: cysteine desulfurase [Ruminococcaceae bacterium]|nr:cysteine desulfurase [Oscillospiraceae bacterium]
MVYLDNSATTKPCLEVISAVNNSLQNCWGNPSSSYDLGITAMDNLENSRKVIADFIGAKTDEIIFTSGGTEANNTAIFGVSEYSKRKGKKIITSSIEHPSVLEPLKQLESRGFNIVYLTPDKDGKISVDDFKKEIDGETILVSLMLVNNEIGSIQPIFEISKIIKEKNSPALLHCDAVQGFGKLPIKVSKLGVDLLSASGHKIHGPKGIGFLYKSSSVKIPPFIFGGGQESGMRSGTENMPLISGLSAAVKALPDLSKTVEEMKILKEYAIERLSNTGLVSFNSPVNSLPYIINISVDKYKSEPLMNALAARGIYVSKGSACAKGHRSYVLSAIGLDTDRIDSALRISFSRYTKTEDIDILCNALSEITAKMRRFKK